MLQRAHTLRTLDLVNTGLGDEGARTVLRAIRAWPQGLERLYLGGNGLTVASAAVAAELLAANPRIVALYLGTNHLRNAGAAALAEGLRKNGTLRELSLPANGLSAEGAVALGTALRGHAALELLDLGVTRSAKKLGAPENAIDGAAAEALADFVAAAPQLRVLNLRGNALETAAVLRIVEAGEGRTRPCAIHVEGNPCNRRARMRAVALAEGAEPLAGRDDVGAIRSRVR
jgi:Ran GTPase-activating protein (RanGAP) involved in mRNA processing and transport